MKIDVCTNYGRGVIHNAWVTVDLDDEFAIESAQMFNLELNKITNSLGKAFYYRAYTDIKTARKFAEYCE